MSTAVRNRILFLLFVLSGFCGLAYQVVWLRLAFASFGIITPVLSVVISVFMLGLALGSFYAGRWVEGWSRRSGLSPIYFYALAEVVIGFGAFAVPALFGQAEGWLLPLGEMGSTAYLVGSGLLLGAAILPWCLAMGTTFPLMMAFVREQDPRETSSFSFLYFANVVGAMAGVLLTAVVLIELLGFQSTLVVAAVTNWGVAAIALAVGRSQARHEAGATPDQAATEGPDRSGASQILPESGWLIPVALFTTGFCSMGLEVIWTRAFVPILGTMVYSFASLLFTYLLATWVGSGLYRRDLARGKVVSTPGLLLALAASGSLPIILNDPRVFQSAPVAVGSIFPLCALLGYMTPKLIDRFSAGQPDRAGQAYAVNVVGSILGPLFSAYVLLPAVGARFGMVALGLPFLLLALVALRPAGARAAAKAASDAGGVGARLVAAALATVLLAVSSFVNVSVEEGYGLNEVIIRRDHTATVISYGTWRQRGLLINGVGITSLVPVAKVMAHLPLAFRSEPPQAAAVICFGMGTTFRSLMSWEIEATAVELARGVADSFPYYHEDAFDLLKDPRSEVAVDDGRRFLQRSEGRFDVITIDPPPPPEAAGSSLLYSKDFYRLLRKRLTPDGILHQWYPGGEPLITSAVTRSLTDSFAHVRAFLGYQGGIHFLASMAPLEKPTPEEFVARFPERALEDLVEWNEGRLRNPVDFARTILRPEVDVPKLLNSDPRVVITDDHPFNEYYLLRRYLPWLWSVRDEESGG